MKRREFIILTGLGATSATVLSACGHPENKLIPALIPDNEFVPGLDYWKASTCAMCDAGCGIVVRTREHKANKIEGNPLHPVNRGALCARGQAGLQTLYNPDRIRGPLKRTGERGSGQFAEIGWDEAIKTLADKLREIKAQGRNHLLLFATSDSAGVTGLAAELFMSGYGAKWLVSEDILRSRRGLSVNNTGYGSDPFRQVTANFDIANARYLLSFGARFLETWNSPVMQSLAYGEFRRTGGKARGKLVQIEPRMSLTGANADEWLPAAVGTEGLVALAMAQVIIREGLVKDVAMPSSSLGYGLLSRSGDQALVNPGPDSIAGHLDMYAPEKTATVTDIPADKIIRIAREFAASQPALAIGSGSIEIGRGPEGVIARSSQQVQAIHYLNHLVGNLNKPGGVIINDANHFDALAKWRGESRSEWLPMTGKTPGGYESAFLIHHANPVHNEPQMADRIKMIPFVASFSSVIDETTILADLILPDHSHLERWDIGTNHSINTRTIVSLVRPVVEPQYNTKQTAEVLLALGHEFGQALAFKSPEEVVRQAVSELASAKASGSDGKAEDFWKTFTDQGVLVQEIKDSPKSAKGVAPQSAQGGADEVFDSLEQRHIKDDEYPLVLLTYEHATLGFGEQANLPWLQELPDPMTSVIWGSWVEINPKTAASLGINDGDLVEVRTAEGALTAPAVLYPAIRPDCVAMPYGQGHTAYGRYASNRGANAALLNLIASMTGEAMTVRARVSKAQGEARLIRFGTELLERIETHRPR